MKKKLQVFISSTYSDLIEERQAAVEAVLSAGHIPAGMELFKAGDETQKETIKKWIDESDVYVLLVGGRYGSLEPKSGVSYTQWEYEYAGKIGKPRFSLVMTEDALDLKVSKKGRTVLERENIAKLDAFKKTVLGKTSEFFDDVKDIKLSIIRKMGEFQSNDNLIGWVSGKDIKNNETLATQVAILINENELLKKELDALKIQNNTATTSSITLEKTNDENFNRSTRSKFYERLDRVFELKNFKEIYSTNEIIEWVADGIGQKLNFPTGRLRPYFVENEEGSIDKLLIVAEIKEIYDYQSALGDIRVTISNYDSDMDMDIFFLITHPANQPSKKEHASEFFKKVIKIVKNKSKFSFDFWDEQSLTELEKELLLTI